MAFDSQRQILYVCISAVKRTPFRSTAFSETKSNSCSGGDQISGGYFDRMLSFVPHLKYVKKKALKALNILKVVGNTEWEADRKVMLRLHISLIRSKLDYGCIVYGSARKSYLQMLDPIYNQGLRLCLGAFRTSLVESLYVDIHEPSLGVSRTRLSLQYATKIKSLLKYPAHNV